MPIYHLCTLAIPKGIIKQIETIHRQCLWRGNSETPRKSLAAWDLVCRPKNKGGLGILNIQAHNEALLMKHLHKFYNHDDVPWVSLVWDAYYHHLIPGFKKVKVTTKAMEVKDGPGFKVSLVVSL